jgi:hypothetical protein
MLGILQCVVASYRCRTLSYTKLIHVTRAAHALHGVCEIFRALHPNVDKPVANWEVGFFMKLRT